MAEKTTIARPYAQALFEVARDKGNLPKASDALNTAAAVAADPGFASVIGDPSLSDEQLASVVIDICGKDITEEVTNFIKVLADNGRLDVLPEIAKLFDEYRAEEESTIDAEVTSASELSDAQRQEIASSLKKRLGREVTLQCNIDESIIGGAIIRAGDLVIDGSITGQLKKLSLALSR